MATIKSYKKKLIDIVNTSDYSYNCETPETERSKSFNRSFNAMIKGIFKEVDGYKTFTSSGNFCGCSGFVSKKTNDELKYVYYSVSDYRTSFGGPWYDHILIRSAKNEKDYTGGYNQYTTIEDIKENIDKILNN